MKETVLLYNFTDSGRLLKVKQALLPLGFRLRAVEKKDYLRPVGLLAGAKETEEYDGWETRGDFDGSGFEDEMLFMAGFTSPQIDALIKALRKTGVGKVDYKAVLTESNKTWNSLKLYEEIKKEHKAMSH